MNILCTVEEFTINNFPRTLNIIKNPYKRKLTETEVDAMIQEYKPIGIIAGVEPLTRKVLERAEGLKIISRYGVGLDSVDLKAAAEFGIQVFNTPDAPTVAVAELTVGLMLGVLRHIREIDKGIREGVWPRLVGSLLSGKTIGIIGCGRIGTYLARLVKAFGCEVIGYDPYLNEHPLCTLHSLEELLQLSDIVSLHIPFSIENKHIINSQRLNLMKPDAVLINAGRGGLIDEEALFNSLESGKIAGAALDCFESEPYSGHLSELKNVLLTSHIGSNARETKAVMEEQSLNNLVGALEKLGCRVM